MERTIKHVNDSKKPVGVRVIISGWRGWTNETPIHQTLKQIKNQYGPNTTLVHGNNPKGVDAIAEKIWVSWGLKTEKFSADWTTYGKGAGPVRNQQMVDAGAALAIIFASEQSKGTYDLLNRAKTAKIPVWLHVAGNLKKI